MMDDNLTQVYNCLRTLDSSKLTERKKSATILEQALGTDSVIASLDANSVRSDRKLITWNAVLKGVIKYVDCEITTLQSSKESNSATTINSRDKRKKEIAALFRLVVKTANERGSVRIKLGLIIDTIDTVLNNPYMLDAFGTEYSQVLLKSVLRVRHYWLELQPGHWKKFLLLYCKLYDESKLDSVILARVIQELVHGNILQGEPYSRKIFLFFTKVFENIKELKSQEVIGNMLGALNSLCHAVAPNCRMQLCHFGESLMGSFVYLWGRGSEEIKEELVKFLHLLVQIHHPRGVSNLADGAYAENWEEWKNHLTSFHEMVCSDLEEKYTFLTGSKLLPLKPSYVSFAADVFKQIEPGKLFPSDKSILKMSSQTHHHGNSITATPAKRQRLSKEGISLLEALKDRSNTLQAIPWLQILQQLLKKYPECFGQEGLVCVFQIIATLLSECKRGQLFSFLYEVLTALIRAYQLHGKEEQLITQQMTSIWSHCISSINSRQAEVDGYQEHGLSAMACIVTTGLITPMKEIWNFFLPSYSSPSPGADQLLTSLVVTFGLPDNYAPSIIGTPFVPISSGEKSSFPLRCALITWLLPTTSFESGPSKLSMSPVRVAELLFALTLKDPCVMLQSDKSRHIPELDTSVHETVYLKSTFDYSYEHSSRASHPLNEAVKPNNPHISAVFDFLIKHILTLSELLDSQMPGCDYLSCLSCVLAKLLYFLDNKGQTSVDTQKVFKKVLDHLTTVTKAKVSRDGLRGLMGTFNNLCAMVTWDDSSNQKLFWIAEVIRASIPAAFLEMAIDITSGQLHGDKRRDPPKHHRRRHRPFDDDIHQESTSRHEFDTFNSSSHAMDVEFESENNMMDLDDTKTSTDVSNFLLPENLSETQQVRLLCTELLGKLISHNGHRKSGQDERHTGRPQVDVDQVKGRLLNLIATDYYDPKLTFHVHVLFTVTRQLLTHAHRITPTNIKSIMGAFKQTAKALNQDQQICCSVVTHLRYIIPHLCDPPDSSPASEELLYCRDIFFIFISDFWHLANEGTFQLKLEVIKALLDLIKHDPEGTWGHLKVMTAEDDQKFELVTACTLITQALAEGNVQIRNFVAESIKWLFVKKDTVSHEIPRDKVSQSRAFDNVFVQCSDLFDFEQQGMTKQRLADEMTNRQATCLQVLMNIILCSPYCEKQCLLGMCQLIADKDIPLDIVKKMLTFTCQNLKFPDVKTYVEYHLPYLVRNWLQKDVINSPIEKFPYQILGCADVKQFVQGHQDLIVTEILVTKLSLDEIHPVLNAIHVDVHEALLSALPQILVNILPLFASKPQKDDPGSLHKQFRHATACYSTLQEFLSEKEINDCVSDRLSDIVMRLLNCLDIEKSNYGASGSAKGETSLKMIYPPPNPPCYSHQVVRITLDHMAQNFTVENEEDASLVNVLIKTPDGISQVLLSLSTSLWHTTQPFEQVRYLKMYGLFVDIVLVELPSGLGGGWASIVRDITNRLLIILRNRAAESQTWLSPSYEEEAVLTCLGTLHNVVTNGLTICPDEIVNYIQQIVDAVASIGEKSSSISQKSVLLLTDIITSAVDCPELKQVLGKLNPLPPAPGLETVKLLVDQLSGPGSDALENQFKSFLEVCVFMADVQSQGLALRLQKLTTCIINNQGELKSMAASDTGLTCLRKVIDELVKLVTSPCGQVMSAAAACLGAIGPLDLQCLSLPHSPEGASYALAIRAYRGHKFEKYCWVFHALDSCLIEQNLKIVKTAGHILQTILATPLGEQFEADYSKRLKDKSFLFYYLHPFKRTNTVKGNMGPPAATTTTTTIKLKDNLRAIDRADLWLGSQTNLSHKDWIQGLTSELLKAGLIQDEIMNKIQPMCALKSSFCVESLPYLIHDILENGATRCREILSSHISAFFNKFNETSSGPASAPGLISVKKESVRTMLNVVQYLRKQERPQDSDEVPGTAWNNNFWLDINYLEVAGAAQYCGANFSAVLFAEIWWDIKQTSGYNTSFINTSTGSPNQDSPLDPLSGALNSQETGGQRLQALLLEAYKNIGDPDGIYGCGAGRMAEPMARVQTYLHEGEQTKALTTLDIEISHSSTQSITPLLEAVESCGADYILQRCLSELKYDRWGVAPQSSSKTSSPSELEEFAYQAAWKLGQWDVKVPARQKKSVPFHQSLYHAMSSLQDGHLDVAKCAVEAARKYVVSSFDPKVENSQSLSPFLCQLQCLSHLDHVLECSLSESNISVLADGCHDNSFDFEYIKPQLYLAASVGKILAERGSQSGEDLEVRALWSLAVCGRKAKSFQLAEKAVRELKTKDLSRTSWLCTEQLHVEEAKLFWARSEVNIAMSIMKTLITKLSQDQAPSTSCPPLMYAQALGTYGSWLAETKSSTPTVIISDYLEKTVTLMLKHRESTAYDDTAPNSFMSLARFADEQYQQVADHMRSPTFQDKQNLLQRSKSELEEYQGYGLRNSKYLTVIEKNMKIDQEEITSMVEDRGRYLQQALVNYLRCLQHGDLHDLNVFRVVALWFENCDNQEVNVLMKKNLKTIKSYKFLPLYYQLAARMSSTDITKFQPVLTELMQRVAEDHPHHALWIILALAHAYKDDEILSQDSESKTEGKLATSESENAEVARVEAAKNLLQLLKRRKAVSEIVENMELLCLAYIQLANSTASNRAGSHPIPKNLSILKLPKLDNVLLPSVELKVDPTGNYKNLVSPVRFNPDFKVIGGINLPKVIICHGSDGQPRTQLVKGRDDLRQDAVMQQVFSLVNQLLAGAAETRQRQLKIRTYKVIPLSQKCGLLQWCEGTQPLGEYLIRTSSSSPGAHVRYRPKDWLAKDCRIHLDNAGTAAEKRFKAYQDICAHFKPVFRHFFMENFPEPSVWFEKRLAYTRSVATNSIVGYILGLGDRHVMNILIDLQTAELVHIDLGIAFDMGHILATPETVPFRLTRDIVDGMGVTGVEGAFRRCCEKTMHVMKDNSESLLTIVQVLLYDPLSHWSLTPQQALDIQRKREQANQDNVVQTLISSGQVPSSGQVIGIFGPGESDTGLKTNESRENQNKLAERTLLRLKQKLNGLEGNAQLSVSGQVNFLIQKASDPRNLCKLYPGWQPYL